MLTHPEACHWCCGRQEWSLPSAHTSGQSESDMLRECSIAANERQIIRGNREPQKAC